MWILGGLELVLGFICRLVTSWGRSLEGWGKGLWLILAYVGVWFQDTCWRWREPWAGNCTYVLELYEFCKSLLTLYARLRTEYIKYNKYGSDFGAIKIFGVRACMCDIRKTVPIEAQIINDCDFWLLGQCYVHPPPRLSADCKIRSNRLQNPQEQEPCQNSPIPIYKNNWNSHFPRHPGPGTVAIIAQLVHHGPRTGSLNTSESAVRPRAWTVAKRQTQDIGVNPSSVKKGHEILKILVPPGIHPPESLESVDSTEIWSKKSPDRRWTVRGDWISLHQLDAFIGKMQDVAGAIIRWLSRTELIDCVVQIAELLIHVSVVPRTERSDVIVRDI
jgi:hypothetical protein